MGDFFLLLTKHFPFHVVGHALAEFDCDICGHILGDEVLLHLGDHGHNVCPGQRLASNKAGQARPESGRGLVLARKLLLNLLVVSGVFQNFVNCLNNIEEQVSNILLFFFPENCVTSFGIVDKTYWTSFQ